MASKESKRELRARMLAERRALSPQAYMERSRAVLSRMEALPEFSRAPLVLTYVASKDQEVDTRTLFPALRLGGRSIGVPRVVRRGEMEWRRIGGLPDLASGRFGILEPLDASPVLEVFPEGTVVLVPGIAFTRQGDRVGYGGGYFDRFLKGFAGISIGLAFDFQVVEELHSEAHDVRVDIVVTENAVHRQKAQAPVSPEI